MKLFLFIMIMMNASFAQAQTRGGILNLIQDNSEVLFTALTGVLTSSGTAVQDSAWPGYRLMDANGILKVLSDITGPDTPGATYSTSSHLVWSAFGYNQNLRIQTRFADFGGTCDLNNPSGLATDYYQYIYVR